MQKLNFDHDHGRQYPPRPRTEYNFKASKRVQHQTDRAFDKQMALNPAQRNDRVLICNKIPITNSKRIHKFKRLQCRYSFPFEFSMNEIELYGLCLLTDSGPVLETLRHQTVNAKICL